MVFTSYVFSQVEKVEEDLRAQRKEVENATTKLEMLANQWIDLESEVEKVKLWALEEVPTSVELFQSSTVSSDEKARRNEQLQTQLIAKISSIQKLSENFDSLISK